MHAYQFTNWYIDIIIYDDKKLRYNVANLEWKKSVS